MRASSSTPFTFYKKNVYFKQIRQLVTRGLFNGRSANSSVQTAIKTLTMHYCHAFTRISDFLPGVDVRAEPVIAFFVVGKDSQFQKNKDFGQENLQI